MYDILFYVLHTAGVSFSLGVVVWRQEMVALISLLPVLFVYIYH
jgi:hypothetical protein